jgi:hypothetical protein
MLHLSVGMDLGFSTAKVDEIVGGTSFCNGSGFCYVVLCYVISLSLSMSLAFYLQAEP